MSNMCMTMCIYIFGTTAHAGKKTIKYEMCLVMLLTNVLQAKPYT